MIGKGSLFIPSPSEVRDRINGIREDDYLIPSPSEMFPDGVRRINGYTVKLTAMLALIGGFRISEICTKYTPNQTTGNSSETLKLFIEEHKATGQEALRIQVNALKKKAPVIRDLGIPMDPHSEPYSEKLYKAWEKQGGNPCNINRHASWQILQKTFEGFGYTVDPRVVYKRDNEGKLLRDENGKTIIDHTIEQHIKQAGNHFLRHIRLTELRTVFQMPLEERVSFFKWSPGGFGINPMAARYDKIEWFEYFPKLLRR